MIKIDTELHTQKDLHYFFTCAVVLTQLNVWKGERGSSLIQDFTNTGLQIPHPFLLIYEMSVILQNKLCRYIWIFHILII